MYKLQLFIVWIIIIAELGTDFLFDIRIPRYPDVRYSLILAMWLIAFAAHELSGADPIACRLDDFLKETDDPYAAAAEFTAGFERCISDSGSAEDVYAGSLYPEFYGEHYQGLKKRVNKAMNYHARFVGSGIAGEDNEINITIE